jgi:hypothetical protein
VAMAEGKNTLQKERYRVESLSSDSPELTSELLNEISDFFRYTFNNSFPEYVVCTDCDVQFSAMEVLGTEKYIPLHKLDDENNVPCCPKCDEKMEFFHDMKTVSQKIEENLKKNAYISLLRNNKNEKLEGLAFARFDTFENTFQKEWANEYIYMGKQENYFDRDMDSFCKKINKVFQEKQLDEIRPQSEVFCWNCTAINPEAQGLGNLLKMLRKLFVQLSEEEQIGHFVLETRTDSTAHKLLKMAGAIDIPEIFSEESGQIFMSGELKEVSQNLQLSLGKFIGLLKKQKICNNKNIH